MQTSDALCGARATTIECSATVSAANPMAIVLRASVASRLRREGCPLNRFADPAEDLINILINRFPCKQRY
jgi:hypothetical protein